MRIAIIGQQDFGKAVLDAFVSRGDTVAGVFCAPEKAGGKLDPLAVAADAAGIPVYRLPSLKSEEARGDGKKIPAPQLCQEAGLTPGAVLGD